MVISGISLSASFDDALRMTWFPVSFLAEVWDVGGQDKIRPLWRHYYQGTCDNDHAGAAMTIFHQLCRLFIAGEPCLSIRMVVAMVFNCQLNLLIAS